MAGSIMQVVSHGRKRKHTKKVYVKVKPVWSSRSKRYLGGNGIKESQLKAKNVFKYPKPTIQRGLNFFNPRVHARLRYGDAYTITGNSAGTAVIRAWRLNSLFDVDFTAGGHQPFQLDQISGIYKRSIVYGAQVNIVWNDPDADGIYVGFNIVGPSGITCAGLSLNDMQETENVQMVRINNSGSQIKKQSVYIPLPTLNNVNKTQFMSDTSSYSEATLGAVISKVNRIELFALDSLAGTAKVQFTMTMTLHCLLYDLIPQGSS